MHALLTAYRTRSAQRPLLAGQEFYYDQPVMQSVPPMYEPYGYEQPMVYEQPMMYEQPMPMQMPMQVVEQPHYEMMPMPVATSPVPVPYVEPMKPQPPPPPPVHRKKQGNSCRCGSPALSQSAAAGKRGPLTGPHVRVVWCVLSLLQVRLPRRVGRGHVRLRGVDHGAALLCCQDAGKCYQEGVQLGATVRVRSLP